MAPAKTVSGLGEKNNSSVERLEFFAGKEKDPITIEKAETSSSNLSHDEDKHYTKPPMTAKDLVSEILLVEDDPTLNPWTFRTWFIGIGLSIFSSYASGQAMQSQRLTCNVDH
jgi:hypothetical protein